MPAPSNHKNPNMKIEAPLLRKIIEGALLAADGPLSLTKLAKLFEVPEGETDPDYLYDKPRTDEIMAALEEIQADCEGRGYELKQVASGWRFQVVQEVAPWVNRLWEEKPQRYSRALLETLALIAYRQPITRGDIESIRGVAVSSTIIKTLTEREWVKVVGHRDVPGRPALYATTRQFLDYFNLKSLDELPSLKEIQDFEKLEADLDLAAVAESSEAAPTEGEASESAMEMESSEAQSEETTDIQEDLQAEAAAAAEEDAEAEVDPEIEAVDALEADDDAFEDDDLRLDEPFESSVAPEPIAQQPESEDAEAGDEEAAEGSILEQEEL